MSAYFSKMKMLFMYKSLELRYYLSYIHSQINNNSDRTIDVFFSRFRCSSFTIWRKTGSLSLSCNSTQHARNSFWSLSQGYIRVIVNERPLNREKTTSSVLSVLLLINAYILPYYLIKPIISGSIWVRKGLTKPFLELLNNFKF